MPTSISVAVLALLNRIRVLRPGNDEKKRTLSYWRCMRNVAIKSHEFAGRNFGRRIGDVKSQMSGECY